MNNTNRALNRGLILVAGLLLLCAATLLGLIALQSAFGRAWTSGAESARLAVSGWLQATPLTAANLGTTMHSWLWIVALAALAGIVTAMLAFIFRQGHGHAAVLITEQATDRDTTRVDSSVAEESLRHALADYPEFLSTRVSTYRVAQTSVLKVSVTCRRGTSPTDVVRIVNNNLRALDALLGQSIPALLQISGGFQVRASRGARFQ
jgi:hypothetical protein